MDSGFEWEVYQKCKLIEFIEYLWILDFKLNIFLIFIPHHIYITYVILNLSLKVYVLLLF